MLSLVSIKESLVVYCLLARLVPRRNCTLVIFDKKNKITSLESLSINKDTASSCEKMYTRLTSIDVPEVPLLIMKVSCDKLMEWRLLGVVHGWKDFL